MCELAALYGVERDYRDGLGRDRRPEPAVVERILVGLGASLRVEGRAEEAVRARHAELAQEGIPPVLVARDGVLKPFEVLSPSGMVDRADISLSLEDGRQTGVLADVVERSPSDSTRRGIVDTTGVEPLPPGYHELELRCGRRRLSARVISAPGHVYAWRSRRSGWGVFLPLYALESRASWGVGSLSDLSDLCSWAGRQGADVVATLPLLASFLDDPCEPSPYRPVSRLFWNEIYLDVQASPEYERSPEAQQLVLSSNLRAEIEAARKEPWVDYPAVAGVKRQVLEVLARTFFESFGDERRQAYEQFRRSKPELDGYAEFRARSGGADEELGAANYHRYVQWLAAEQMIGLGRAAQEAEVDIALDLPLGVHPDGYDVVSREGLFCPEFSAGAPPDGFFAQGQCWGIPPVQPGQSRATGHQYFIDSLRHLMSTAGMLRIDHVMHLERLYWVPEGCEADEGTYVRYPADELLAIVALESHRSRTGVVGEDLGTVSNTMRDSLDREALSGQWVLQFECTGEPDRPFRDPVSGSVASLGTHDTPPYASFLAGSDIDFCYQAGLIDENERDTRRARRLRLVSSLGGRTAGDLLADLGASDATLVMVGLEDLWGERRPQNVPGTTTEWPNWRRKSSHTLEELSESAPVISSVRVLDEARRGIHGN